MRHLRPDIFGTDDGIGWVPMLSVIRNQDGELPAVASSETGRRWTTEDGVMVEVAGEVRDQDTGDMLPFVSVNMVGSFAHHLAHVLADWSAIGDLFESGRGADESTLAAVLHDAAHSTGDKEALRCIAVSNGEG